MEVFLKRTLTGIILIPSLIIFLIYAPDRWFLLVVLVVNSIALVEFLRASPYSKDRVFLFLTLLLGASVNVSTYYLNEKGILGVIYLSLFFFFIYGFLRCRDLTRTIPAIGFGILGLLYVSLLLSYLILINQLKAGRRFLIFLLIVVWCVDTTAYYIGKRYGRVRLAPTISPYKTVEGAFGGFIGGIVGASLFWAFFLNEMPLNYTLYTAGGIGILAQVSDLSESLYKRWAGIKDSGGILPGHGGILDRIDSLLFTSPFFYYMVRFTIVN